MLLDILFPKFCVGCNKVGKYICDTCSFRIITINTNVCPYCERESFLGKKHPSCIGDLDGVISIFHYNQVTKKIIKSIKYKLQYAVCDEFFQHIPQEHISNIKKSILPGKETKIQQIPLHSKRLKERGFNQIETFAKFLQNSLSIPQTHVLKRIKYTQPQARREGREARKVNVSGAFQVIRNDIKVDTIILVDDVYTTGYTCQEAANVLKRAGVKRVFAITLARG